MNDKIQDLLRSVQNTPDFGYVDFHSINDTNALGDNALHCVCSWGDMDAARMLVENGINFNQRGELGFTPLNVAMVFGHQSLADYLLAQGADPRTGAPSGSWFVPCTTTACSAQRCKINLGSGKSGASGNFAFIFPSLPHTAL